MIGTTKRPNFQLDDSRVISELKIQYLFVNEVILGCHSLPSGKGMQAPFDYLFGYGDMEKDGKLMYVNFQRAYRIMILDQDRHNARYGNMTIINS